jgi:small-conductance mechanosensitive channel
MLGAGVLALLHDDVAVALQLIGVSNRALVTPIIVALIAFAAAYTINAALSAFVWPQHTAGQADAMQRAPAILRNLVTLLLYSTAALWAAAFVFNLDLGAVGLTSGAVGLVVGFAVQRLIADFFSGVMLGIERPFALGDWIELNANGQSIKGVLSEMTWRIALVRDSNLDLVSIPNSLLAQAAVVNRSRPNRYTEVSVRFSVADSVPHSRIADVVKEAVAPLLGNVVLAQPEPRLSIAEIADGDLRYRLNVYATLGPNSESPIRTKVIERLQVTFAAAGIPFSATVLSLLEMLANAHSEDRKPN